MGIDITDSRNVKNITRGAEEGKSSYYVNLWVKSEDDYAYYEIDGRTGAILEKTKAALIMMYI